jgi:diaminopimelate epimerase
MAENTRIRLIEKGMVIIMTLKFTKMQGAGNDYIYFNCFSELIDNPEELSIKLSDRHFGVGGDGIVLICPSETCDAKMRMFNADGSEGKMCGNAIRCVTKYLIDNDMVKKEEISIETLSGIKKIKIIKKNKQTLFCVNMGKPELNPKIIPVKINGETVINRLVKIGDLEYNITCVSMGNPHCIVFYNDIDNIEIEKIGPLFENNEIFPDKVNTEFVKVIDKNTIALRVWERGSGETLACGTGACASVVASVLNGLVNINEEVTVKLKGGELYINYCDDTVYMTGAAEKVFDGEIKL